MILIFLIGFLIVVTALLIGRLLHQVLAPSGSSRQDPPGLGPAQLLPPTVQWRRPWWVSTAITETNSTLYMVLGMVGMLITLSVAVMLILRGSAGRLSIFPFGTMLPWVHYIV